MAYQWISTRKRKSVPFENLTKEEWCSDAVQSSYIGASQAADIFGYGFAGGSPLSVWERLVHPDLAPKFDEDAEHLVMGQKLEMPIADAYAERYGCKLWFNDRRIWRHHDHPFIGATPDFIDWKNKRNVQTKNISVFASDEWEDGEAPLKYQIQCQQEMAVTGLKETHLVGLIGGNRLEVRTIERNERFIQVLIDKLVAFWMNHVVPQIPPEPTVGKDFAVLARLHPDDNGKAVRMSVSSELLDEWKGLQETRLTAQKREDEIKAFLAWQLGENTFGVIDDQVISLKTQERKPYEVKASKTRVLRLVPKGLPEGMEIEDG